MTTSASTPRLRLTLLWYLALLALAAVNRPPSRGAWVEAAFALGALLLVSAAVLGRIWCSVFIAGRKDAELVTIGPYAMCRHPLYTLSMLGGFGLGLATGSLLLSVATLLWLASMFWRASIAEEAFLATRHGAALASYVDRTPRFWPRFTASALPPNLEVRPPVLWKAFVDAGSFMLLWALVVAARVLQSSGALPAWLALP